MVPQTSHVYVPYTAVNEALRVARLYWFSPGPLRLICDKQRSLGENTSLFSEQTSILIFVRSVLASTIALLRQSATPPKVYLVLQLYLWQERPAHPRPSRWRGVSPCRLICPQPDLNHTYLSNFSLTRRTLEYYYAKKLRPDGGFI